ncbi:MAG TPA: hypothetical protein VGJ11_06240 [Gaiellales bacterium]
MSSQPSPPSVSSSAGDDPGIGFAFFARMAGLIIAAGVVALIVMLVFFRAVYAWGLLGGFIAFAVILLAVGWWSDRRRARRDPLG